MKDGKIVAMARQRNSNNPLCEFLYCASAGCSGIHEALIAWFT